MQQTLVRGKYGYFHYIHDLKQDGGQVFSNNNSEVSYFTM